MSSRRMGNRSKTLLKKGQTLGERAILDGEPAGETCMAGSPVVTLLVNRSDQAHATPYYIAQPFTADKE